MRLYAISDLHCNRPQTWQLMQHMSSYTDDWLIVAGDVCDGWSEERFSEALELLKHRFAQVFWTPGNHELYTLNGASSTATSALKGVAKYEHLIQLCRNAGVITPEDPFEKWPCRYTKMTPPNDDQREPEESTPLYVCPIFTLYDYSFRPANVSRERCIEWAAETKVVCTDEFTLYPDPFPSRDLWCSALVEKTEAKLSQIVEQYENNQAPHTILASHFSLRYDMVYSPFLPRFSLWCGTTKTEDWHRRFNADAVIYGHTHLRNTVNYEGCRFCEVSLGYPNQYASNKKFGDFLVQIVPNKVDGDDGCVIC